MNKTQQILLTFSPTEKETISKLQADFKPIFEKFINTDNDWSFFLSPYTYEYLLQILPKYFEKIKEKVDRLDTLEQWEIKNMLVILGKALIPDSYSPTFQNAKDVAHDIVTAHGKNKRIHIRELCTGAGLSTILTVLELKKLKVQTFTLIGTDNALESIIISSFLLSIFDIPHIIIKNNLTESIYNYNGVVLQYMDIHNALSSEVETGKKYDAIFSDHGISYFSPQVHERVIENSIKMLENKSSLYICSLEPKIKIKLNTFETLKEIFMSKGHSLERIKRIRAEREKKFKNGQLLQDMIYFDFQELKNGESHVKKYYTDDAAKIYNMLNAFIFDKKYKNIKLFFTYLKVLSNITKASRELGNDVQSPISYTQSLLKKYPRTKCVVLPPIEEGRRPMRTIKISLTNNHD